MVATTTESSVWDVLRAVAGILPREAASLVEAAEARDRELSLPAPSPNERLDRLISKSENLESVRARVREIADNEQSQIQREIEAICTLLGRPLPPSGPQATAPSSSTEATRP